ncbi:MAG TPA: ATP-binding protein [Solirubrobacteraceae bacterium]|jgi:hypothetical protein
MAEQEAAAADAKPHVGPADFIDGGEKETEIDVRLSYGIIERFSEGLYSSPNKAFEELVSNSYDAGARTVWVRVPDDLDPADAYLAVIDDGISMDIAGFEALWEIGVSPKRPESGPELTNLERAPIGKFGIGKLATYVLANQLTYICKKGSRYLAVTMDYGRAHGAMSDPTPMSLDVVRLTASEAKTSLINALGDDALLKQLFGSKAVLSWTAAILGELKERGRALERGRLRWILRSALPLSDEFTLWFNKEELTSSKADGTVDWDFTIGQDDAALENWPYAAKLINDEHGPGVQLDSGIIRGKAQLFTETLKRGKSEELGRSHGFFVKVRGRLVNLDDETFGVDVELHHGVLTRFRMDVDADGLDAYIASPRESIQESAALTEVQGYLLNVFNRARSVRAKLEAQGAKDLLAAAERVAAPPPALSTMPLRRVLRRALDGDSILVELFGLDAETSAAARDALETHDALIQRVVIEALGHEKPLVRYDIAKRAVVVNSNHPFVSNYLGVHGAAEPLRMVGVTELLTQVYMLDEDIEPGLVMKILNRRDEFLRALAHIHPRSAPVIARALRDAKTHKDELEDAVADGMQILGYEVTRIGGNNEPDGIARARLGARQIDGGSTDYSVTYDSKSSKHDAIQAATAKTDALRKHREKYDADYSLLVAPGYEGDGADASSIETYCTNNSVTPITVEDLARLVDTFPFRTVTPDSLRTLFTLRTPVATRQYVDEVLASDPLTPPPVKQILALTRELSDRQDAVDVSTLSTALRLTHQIDIPIKPLTAMLRGLSALAPDGLWFEADERFALNASVENVIAELRATVGPLDNDVVGAFRDELRNGNGTE